MMKHTARKALAQEESIAMASISNQDSLVPSVEEYLLRVGDVIGDKNATPPKRGLIPISRSAWLAGVREGRFPQPCKGLGKRISVWKATEIYALISSLSKEKS